MLDLAVQFPDDVIFYNSPFSGTTVPGHAHFQACPKGYMPMERIAGRLLHSVAVNGGQIPESLENDITFVASVRDAQLFHYKHFTRGIFLLRAETSKSMAKMFYRLLDCCDLAEGETEPRFNALTFFSEGEYRAVVMCRAAHRPHHYYAEGEEHFALSPGAADMAGFFVIPEVSDYERLTPEILTEILQEISLSEKQEERLLWRLVRTQPKIEVGILSAPEITFEIISDGAGPQKVSYREGKIDFNGTLYDELVFEAPTISTLFAEPSFILYGVTIGVDFHWQRQQDQQFAGTLKFIVDAGKVVAVNVIGVEDYLLSVISSEMKATASPEFLKAHAVISRSWVMAQIAHRKAEKKASVPYSFDNVPSLVTWLDAARPAEAGQPTGEIVKWFDHDDHHRFDVCADDHCQRYQGLTLAVGEKVRAAIDETWGLTLRFGGELVDARFYKCCGGRTERFSTAWADVDYPYLTVHDDPWCDTHDKEILGQVLNDYDLETEDFHDWTVRYKRADLAALIAKRSGVDIGDLVALEPLERGGSGRIKKLRIVGSKVTLTVGKELTAGATAWACARSAPPSWPPTARPSKKSCPSTIPEQPSNDESTLSLALGPDPVFRGRPSVFYREHDFRRDSQGPGHGQRPAGPADQPRRPSVAHQATVEPLRGHFQEQTVVDRHDAAADGGRRRRARRDASRLLHLHVDADPLLDHGLRLRLP